MPDITAKKVYNIVNYKEASIAIATLVIFGMTFTSHGPYGNDALVAEKAYAMGTHAGISIVYFPQQYKVYTLLIANGIITIGLLGENRYVYQYIIIPAYFILFSILWYAKHTKKLR